MINNYNCFHSTSCKWAEHNCVEEPLFWTVTHRSRCWSWKKICALAYTKICAVAHTKLLWQNKSKNAPYCYKQWDFIIMHSKSDRKCTENPATQITHKVNYNYERIYRANWAECVLITRRTSNFLFQINSICFLISNKSIQTKKP